MAKLTQTTEVGSSPASMNRAANVAWSLDSARLLTGADCLIEGSLLPILLLCRHSTCWVHRQTRPSSMPLDGISGYSKDHTFHEQGDAL